jgi:hypothetical protein
MTEQTVTMCDALVPSPLADGQQLACFLYPHPDDPWHYDNRGLGVWFREDEGKVDTRVGLAARPHSAEEEADRLLPASVRGLDLDRMRQAAPVLRARLVDLLRDSTRQLREARGTVVVPEDTYDTVRRLTAAGEVFRQWRDAFEGAAKEADALTAEEAVTAVGEQDGVPLGSLFVPDGEGHRIAVRPDFASGESVWDVGTLIGWLVDDEAADDRCSCSPPPITDGPERDCPIHGDPMTVAREVARNVVDRLLALGKFTPGAKPIEELRKKLAAAQRDADAGTIRQVRHVGPRTFRGVKIVREEVK